MMKIKCYVTILQIVVFISIIENIPQIFFILTLKSKCSLVYVCEPTGKTIVVNKNSIMICAFMKTYITVGKCKAHSQLWPARTFGQIQRVYVSFYVITRGPMLRIRARGMAHATSAAASASTPATAPSSGRSSGRISGRTSSPISILHFYNYR